MLENIKLVPWINSKEYYISFYIIHECYRKEVNKQAEESCQFLYTEKAICLYIAYGCFWVMMTEASYFINILQITHKSYHCIDYSQILEAQENIVIIGSQEKKMRPIKVVELEFISKDSSTQTLFPVPCFTSSHTCVLSQKARETNNY